MQLLTRTLRRATLAAAALLSTLGLATAQTPESSSADAEFTARVTALREQLAERAAVPATRDDSDALGYWGNCWRNCWNNWGNWNNWRNWSNWSNWCNW